MRCCAAGPWPHSGGALTTLLLTGRSRRRLTAVKGVRASPVAAGPRRGAPSPVGFVSPPPRLALRLRFAVPLSPLRIPLGAGSELPRIHPRGGSSGFPARRRHPQGGAGVGARPPLASPPAEGTAAARPSQRGRERPEPGGARAEGARLRRRRPGCGAGLRAGRGSQARPRAAGWWGRLFSRGCGRAGPGGWARCSHPLGGPDGLMPVPRAGLF